MEYATLKSLVANVKPYLRHLEYKKEKVLKEIELTRKEDIETELSSKKKSISKKLTDMIDSFFHQDLINRLYQKIDPHPDYRTIEFKPNFKDSKPKLNVFVKNKDDSSLISPNLYFSTSQLNILSLSIFLAKALNARDNNNNPVGCIFLDDPIHSMDSINMLSTIDLLRSLVVNYKKQIILSTHDENFFLLLQKKIPQGLMKAKYIELETFGKVKK